MPKFIGKIFRVSNKNLGIKRNGTHYVHVKKYNPQKKVFQCRVITSLEEQKKISPKDRANVLNSTPYHKENDDTFKLFKKKKYKKIREGKIEPIPAPKLEGFTFWSGYEGTVDLTRVQLKSAKEQPQMSIKK